MTTAQPERFDLCSHDAAADKREELLRLFPEVRTEDGQINFDRLRLALGEAVDVGKERYVMTWPGKAESSRAIQTPSLARLRRGGPAVAPRNTRRGTPRGCPFPHAGPPG